ncbi:SpvB-domain-containing protein [Patellaria atrata CBS 101060]|uniref:SpvB-domain-containing protein n=1 Tax=Patellaria atrata CBS 101060 TaxID=1346257 RepID=A0A9P4S760_9PEZI|nr:SpvB-domain-containing protein [Patellaria atrata CBS 101060]
MRKPAPNVIPSRNGDHSQHDSNAPSSLPSSGTPNVTSSPSVSGRGGGAYRSISPDFKVNPINGSMSLSLTIHTSPGRSGFGPSLSLNYDSGSGDGFLGFGWQLSLSSISRKTSKGIPLYDDTDTFVLSGFEDLVPDAGTDVQTCGRYTVQRYKSRVENDVVRIEHWIDRTDEGNRYWKTISGSNVATYYGETDESRIFDTDDQGRKRIFSWLACRTYDSRGNATEFSYKKEDSQGIEGLPAAESLCEEHRTSESRGRMKYIKQISYGNQHPNRDLDTWEAQPYVGDWMFKIVFDYGEHDSETPDPLGNEPWRLRKYPFSACNSGFEIRTYRLCRRILMFHNFRKEIKREHCLVSSTAFQYDEINGVTLLSAVTANGHSPSGEYQYKTESLPPLEFRYTQPMEIQNAQLKTATYETLHQMSITAGFKTEWVDLEGEGAPGILLKLENGPWTYQRNEMLKSQNPHGFGPAKLLPLRPITDFNSEHYFEDMNHDGNMDIVYLDHTGAISGYHERIDEAWSEFSTFEAVPNISLLDQGVKRIDLCGNGFQDVVQEEGAGEVFRFKNLGSSGFSLGQKLPIANGGPRFTSKDPGTGIFTADMTGDGLTDVVEVSNGKVSYWSNLGHGFFGKSVIMNDSPVLDSHEQFELTRVRLADITGSGTSDLLYLPRQGGINVYYNLAGNGWSSVSHISCFPVVDNLSSVFTTDLFGNGTSCLCWSRSASSSHQNSTISFIELAAGGKPHLLSSYSNGLGVHMAITYQSSTKFFLEDEGLGRSWKTKLPFPVQCVSDIVSRDVISQTSKRTRYSYHDGFYDGKEREFRGFGMVENWDEEAFGSEKMPYLQRPPIHTKVWYYTGATYETPDVTDGFSKPLISSTKLPQNIGVDEHYEVYRAIKGSKAREELYSDDDSDMSSIPFYVREFSYEVRRVQGPQGEHPGVYRVVPRQSSKAHYERNINDPKVEFEFALDVNKYGDVVKSLILVNPRVQSTLINPRDKFRQEACMGSYTENLFTEPFDENVEYFHKPFLANQRQYRFVGVFTQDITDFDLWYENGYEFFFKATEEISCNNAIPHSSPPKRSMVKEARTYFWDSALKKRLPLGKVEPFSEVDQTFELVFTEELIDFAYSSFNILQGRELNEILINGGYTKLEEDDRWWVPSARSVYSLDHSKSLQQARRSFYCPGITIDPFGETSEVVLDEHYYLPIESIDPLQNKIQFKNSYIHLQPFETVDANMNLQQSAFDAFGRIVGTARMGKKDEAVGDSLEAFEPIVSKEDILEFARDPCGPVSKRLLGNASQRTVIYTSKFEEGSTTGDSLTSFVAQISCDTHMRDRHSGSQYMISFTYSDGNGSPLQDITLCSIDKSGLARWRVSEWIIKDSKGNSIKICQPSFAPSHRFRFESNIDSPKTTNLLDPLDRVIGTLNADHTWTKVEVNPWSSAEYDSGDTVQVEDPTLDTRVGSFFKCLLPSDYLPTWLQSQDLSSESDPATKLAKTQSMVYSEKPNISHFDGTGNIILSEIQIDKGKRLYCRTEYDVAGRFIARYDQMNRLVEQSWYDYLGRRLLVKTMDSGQMRVIYDCNGKVLFSWTDRGILLRHGYDPLGRETDLWMTESSLPETLLHNFQYGEDVPDSAMHNLRGQVVQIRDQSGVSSNESFDFKGNNLRTRTWMAEDYKKTLDWNSTIELEKNEYATSNVFDAANRLVGFEDSTGCLTSKTYDQAGNLVKVSTQGKKETTATELISAMTYTADSKPLMLKYGNGVTVSYTYDEKTRQILRKNTKLSTGKSIQDIHYTRDCLQRVILKKDSAQDTIYFRNAKVDPKWTYTYDSLGQLVQATGREQMDVSNGGGHKLRPHSTKSSFSIDNLPGNGEQLCEYVENYYYDGAGNILEMKHAPLQQVSVTGWSREFKYKELNALDSDTNSNQLSQTITGGIAEMYLYDKSGGSQNGCMISMPEYSHLSWDHADRLRSSSTQIMNTGTPETTWYVYDHEGTRVRKVRERACSGDESKTTSKLSERVYLPGADIYRTFAGDGSSVISEIISSDIKGLSTIAILERNTTTNSVLIRFQLGDNIELDDQGRLISYEEYSPFGSTTYIACGSGITAPSKYRYAAYERDTETGLFFCEHRYYAPWLGRWISADPLGLADGFNLYEYVGNDPINMHDPSGTMRTEFDDNDNDDDIPRGGFRNKIEKFKDKVSKSVKVVKNQTSSIVKKARNKVGTGIEALGKYIKGNTDLAEPQGLENQLQSTENTKNDLEAYGNTAVPDANHVNTNHARIVGKMRPYGDQHHLFQKKFAGLFRAAGIEPNALTLFVAKEIHITIGPEHDRAWEAFFDREITALQNQGHDLQARDYIGLLNHIENNQLQYRNKMYDQLIMNLHGTGLTLDRIQNSIGYYQMDYELRGNLLTKEMFEGFQPLADQAGGLVTGGTMDFGADDNSQVGFFDDETYYSDNESQGISLIKSSYNI